MTWSIGCWSFGRYTSAVISGFRDALTKRPGHDTDLPLVGCPVLGDCREFGCAGYCSEADDEWDGGYIEMPIIRSGKKNIQDVEPTISTATYEALVDEIKLRFPDSADFQRSQRIGSAEPPAEGAGQPPRSPSAGPTFAQWATPAICEVLANHEPVWWGESESYYCTDLAANVETAFGDYNEWVDHVARIIAAHLETAHKLNVRDGLETAAEWFPQFRKK